jgi:hypothetical protein
MPEKRTSYGTRLHRRLTRWESVLVMVFLVDLFEDRLLFPSPELPAWGKVAIKMAVVVGVLGVVLHFMNRKIDGGLGYTRALGDRLILPRVAVHAAILGGVFVGIYWLKIGRLPWSTGAG